MTLTVAGVEQVVESRIGGFIDQVREITEDVLKPSIVQEASWALRKLGYASSSVTTLTDPELALVSDADADVFLDLTELRVLRSLPGNLPAVDTVVGPQSVKMSNLLPALEAIIARKANEVEAEHGYRIAGSVGSGLRRARLILP